MPLNLRATEKNQDFNVSVSYKIGDNQGKLLDARNVNSIQNRLDTRFGYSRYNDTSLGLETTNTFEGKKIFYNPDFSWGFVHSSDLIGRTVPQKCPTTMPTSNSRICFPTELGTIKGSIHNGRCGTVITKKKHQTHLCQKALQSWPHRPRAGVCRRVVVVVLFGDDCSQR